MCTACVQHLSTNPRKGLGGGWGGGWAGGEGLFGCVSTWHKEDDGAEPRSRIFIYRIMYVWQLLAHDMGLEARALI